VLALLRRAFAGMARRIDPPSSLDRLDAAGLAQKAGAEICLLADATDAEGPVGCVFAAPSADVLYIGKLAVAPERKGRGIGRALIAACAAEARARGLPALELQTRIELRENHLAFARMGFVKVGETAHPGFDRPTSITMWRQA